jgi:hypothetical protein
MKRCGMVIVRIEYSISISKRARVREGGVLGLWLFYAGWLAGRWLMAGRYERARS